MTVAVAGATITLIDGLFPPQAAAIPAARIAAANLQTFIPTPPHDPMSSALPIPGPTRWYLESPTHSKPERMMRFEQTRWQPLDVDV